MLSNFQGEARWFTAATACSIIPDGRGQHDAVGAGGSAYIGSRIVHELVDCVEAVVVLGNPAIGFRCAVPGAAQSGILRRRTAWEAVFRLSRAGDCSPRGLFDPAGICRRSLRLLTNNTASLTLLKEAVFRAAK